MGRRAGGRGDENEDVPGWGEGGRSGGDSTGGGGDANTGVGGSGGSTVSTAAGVDEADGRAATLERKLGFAGTGVGSSTTNDV